MTWAQRLKRVFNLDIETCSMCGGAVRVIACIEDSVIINKILTPSWLHLTSGATRRPLPLRREWLAEIRIVGGISRV